MHPNRQRPLHCIAYSEHVIVDYFPLPPRPMARAGVGSRNPTAFALPDQRLESEEYPCPGLACMGRGGKGKSAEAVRHIVVGKHGKLVPSNGGGGGRSVGEGAWSLAPLPEERALKVPCVVFRNDCVITLWSGCVIHDVVWSPDVDLVYGGRFARVEWTPHFGGSHALLALRIGRQGGVDDLQKGFGAR